ncbi:MAG: phosphoglycerate kinase [Clostridia bacterium]|nr:phosphoglycerate kinase [Clostridia bacterium]
MNFMLNKKSVRDINAEGKKVLVRCDFNVPLQDGVITDDARIVGALPTIKLLLEQGAKVILCSHLGRPKGQFVPEYSLKPVAKRLSELLGLEVKMAEDVVGESAKALTADMKNGEVVLLENVRYHAEETKNVPEFSKQLADLAEIYVNDAFGAAHRAHSSTAGVADYLPAVCGLLIEKEITIIGGALANPERPFVAILGGAKVSDKIGVIENLLEKVDALLIGGGMAYTFMKALGGNIGTSLLEEDKIELAKNLVKKAEEKGVKLVLPKSSVAADKYAADANTQIVSSMDIPEGWMGLDLGPSCAEEYGAIIREAKTVIWNGPMGVCEFDAFANGTITLAKAMSECDGTTIIGGGDSAAAAKKLGFAEKMTHISTGGGASLEFLEGKVLPGIACLQDK